MKINQLKYSWTFWFDKPDLKISEENWDQFLIKIECCDTVEKFWSVFNNILLPSEFEPGVNLHFFKSKIEPKWEDVYNIKGGKWIITIPKQVDLFINKLWENTLVTLISGNYDDLTMENVNGIVLSVRKNIIKLSIWTKNYYNKSIQLRIGKFWKKTIKDNFFINNMTLDYFPHVSLMSN